MLTGALITIREGTEAFLVVAILLSYLSRMGHDHLRKYVWAGALAGTALSILLAAAFQVLAVEFEGTGGEIFEILVALAAVAVLTWMVLWMQRQARSIRSELEQKVEAALSRNQVYALAGLALFSVLREGVETALFLSALVLTARTNGLLLGALLGLGGAAAIVFLIFRTTGRLNLRTFFVATGLLVIFIAAGLIAHSVMSLQELNLLPGPMTPLWDTSRLVSEDGLMGRLLHAFVGYEARPTFLQVVSYLTYVLVMGLTFLQAVQPTKSRPHVAVS